MKPVADSFCTVVVGQWNPNIFRPDWVKKHLANDENDPVEIAFPISDPSLPPRILLDDVFIFPSQGKLDIKAQNPTRENLTSTSAAAKKCLELLRHTPISALGINVAFTSNAEDAESIMRLFSFDDGASIDSNNFKLQGEEIKRVFKLDDCILNLGIVHNTTDIKVDFNFHFDSKDAEDAIQKINDSSAETLYDKASDFLKNTYNLEIEGTEDE